MKRRLVGMPWGSYTHSYGRFRLRRQFLRLDNGELWPASDLQITLVVQCEAESREISVTRMSARRTELPIVMRYLRQWLQSEPLRLAHAEEDRERLRQQQTLADAPASVKERLATWYTNTERSLPLSLLLELFATTVRDIERGDTIIKVDMNDLEGRHRFYQHVKDAYDELAAAHPEIVVDPNEDLSQLDPELAQFLIEQNRRKRGQLLQPPEATDNPTE